MRGKTRNFKFSNFVVFLCACVKTAERRSAVMNRLHLKENSLHPVGTRSLPPTRAGRKRRSSILKPQRPFTDVQNLSRGGDDSRMSKDRRVSFCPTIEVKEFSKHNPADSTSGETDPVTGSRSEDDSSVRQVSLPTPDEELPQMSTPVRKKKRRISAASQIGRLSIIPKFEKSFAFPDDDFVIFEDGDPQSVVPPPATAAREEITLMEDLPEPHCPAVEEDVILDLELNEAPMTGAPPQINPNPPTPSPPANLPRLSEDDNQRLTELFPRAAVPAAANAPTIITTPISNSHYLAMPTPDLQTTPRRLANRRRINIPGENSGEMREGGGGVVKMELTGESGADSPLTRGTTRAEPVSMSLTCFTFTQPSTSGDTTTASEAAGPPPTQGTTSLTTPHTTTGAGSVADTVAMSLTCDELEEEEEEEGGGCGVATPGGVSCDNQVIPAESAVAELRGEGDSQMMMDLTCQSETTISSQDTSLLVTRPSQNTSPTITRPNQAPNQAPSSVSISTQSPPPLLTSQNTSSVPVTRPIQPPSSVSTSTQAPSPPVTAQDTPSATEDTTRPVGGEESRQPADVDKTDSMDQSSRPVVEHDKPPSVDQQNISVVEGEKRVVSNKPPLEEEGGSEKEAGVTGHTSPVFKAPSRPLRTQLSLKSSRKRVVIASPIVLTPHHHHHTSSLSIPPLNTTFTVPPPKPLPPTTRQQTPHPPPPPSTQPPSPGREEAGENLVSSLLASPPPSGPSLTVSPTHAGSAWLQSAGDSFNLVHSGDDTLTSTQEEISSPEPHPPHPEPAASESLQMQTDSQGNVTFTPLKATSVPAPHLPNPSTTPQVTPALNHASNQVMAAVQRIKLGGPPVVAPAIVTPETVMMADPLPPTPPSLDMSVHSLSTKLNNTTLSSGGHTPILSTSIYDKYLVQIYRENQQSSTPTTTTTTTTETVASTDAVPDPTTGASRDTVTGDCGDLDVMAQTEGSGPVSATVFNSFLSDLTSRLQDMLQSVQQRLQSEDYCSTHKCLPLVLDKWSRIFAACLGTLTVLEQYGEISGQSDTCAWHDQDWSSELMPIPAMGQEDMEQDGLSVKLDWIMELSGFYSSIRPTAELARDEAAALYGWMFESWSHESSSQSVTVVLGSTPHHYQLSVSDIASDRFGATKPVAQDIWRHVKNHRLHDL